MLDRVKNGGLYRMVTVQWRIRPSDKGRGGGGGCHPDPSIRGRAVSKIFSLWAKIGGEAGSPGPLP